MHSSVGPDLHRAATKEKPPYPPLLVVVNGLVTPAKAAFALFLTSTRQRLIFAHGQVGDIIFDRVVTGAIFRLLGFTFADVVTLAVRLLHATLILLVLLVLTTGACDL